MRPSPQLLLLAPTAWSDYELIDSGARLKLERFGQYRFVRPEPQAIWRPSLPEQEWASAAAVFQATDDQDGGGWVYHKPIEPRWIMRYDQLKFWVQPTPFRHLGLFPEQASHWDWMSQLLWADRRPRKVLNLFGYTGIATLAAAQAGASVTHVDASKKAIAWARENQQLSQLEDAPVRWLLDDALKFVRREGRRGAQYDGFIIDPPPFGRGPKGEVWRLEESLPVLLAACREILSPEPLFAVLTAYAIKLSALNLYYALDEMFAGFGGTLATGEMVLSETSAGHLLSTAIFARWSAS